MIIIFYIGIDLGTSAVKIILTDKMGKMLKTVKKVYPLHLFNDGWSEQNPKDWLEKTIEGLIELTENCEKDKIAGMSFSGQMHGLVILDENDEVIRPAILWNDVRTVEEVKYLNEVIAKETKDNL